MSLGVPLCLLHLLENYTSQALDAARDVSDEFEGEMTDLLGRARRINAIIRALRVCEKERCSKFLSNSTSNMSFRERVRFTLRGLGQMSAELTGVPVAGHNETVQCGEFSYGLLPLGKPVSLAEAALGLFAQNTKVVVRRVEKRQREGRVTECDTKHSSAHQGSVFLRLSAEQRKRRFVLYAGRMALFSLAIPLPELSAEKGQRKFLPFVSPAVREFSVLNVEAECEMLAAFCRVDTKAQLLRELPTLRNSVELLRESLRAADVNLGLSESAGEEKGHIPWFEFPHTTQGVVQIVIRRSLVVNVTWGSMAGDCWRVLSLHWLLQVQTLPELLCTPSLAEGKLDAGAFVSLAQGGSIPVQPAHHDAIVRYLSKCFETGLESGCTGALRLVNMVVMEVIETQCKTLHETFFVGPLESLFSLDVHPGTHVALTVLPPAVVGSTRNEPLYLRYKLFMGTVVVETRQGTDTRTMRQYDFFSSALGGYCSHSAAVIVDVERVLWRLVSE